MKKKSFASSLLFRLGAAPTHTAVVAAPIPVVGNGPGGVGTAVMQKQLNHAGG